eukprot:CAMPEP_0206425386 /NCGR_PEP_ID=MMETSP0324_2-20121206/3761_1 /ASSEMBLY_ACC=CAM_ASM_000836 /TAXON_ID=2866 /ORGANISM="Crypthecodinium cohnii, Strain Seligo" /LENGTH=87 /DNA_ID=CAMNT_0053890159 /DNA_START=758 /DNA_END=1022 /DNA_ORIENTATION=+
MILHLVFLNPDERPRPWGGLGVNCWAPPKTFATTAASKELCENAAERCDDGVLWRLGVVMAPLGLAFSASMDPSKMRRAMLSSNAEI